MTAEDHIDQAILDLQRARATCRRDDLFALGCIGDARMSIAAAKIAIESPLVPVKRRVPKPRHAQGVFAA